MEAYLTDVKVPEHPFETDPETGNPLFRMRQYDAMVDCRRLDFLIPHRKDYYFFAFIKEGSNRHWIDMKRYTIKPRTLYFTVPHQLQVKEEG